VLLCIEISQEFMPVMQGIFIIKDLNLKQIIHERDGIWWIRAPGRTSGQQTLLHSGILETCIICDYNKALSYVH